MRRLPNVRVVLSGRWTNAVYDFALKCVQHCFEFIGHFAVNELEFSVDRT